ncbi:hypothetical protein, partial [Roseimaritima ulvae]|uniref:hypothetical protein n=1 Tax=Roseimaritima ulvae TaxID=980254 RepID=UPI001EE4A873
KVTLEKKPISLREFRAKELSIPAIPPGKTKVGGIGFTPPAEIMSALRAWRLPQMYHSWV